MCEIALSISVILHIKPQKQFTYFIFVILMLFLFRKFVSMLVLKVILLNGAILKVILLSKILLTNYI